MHCRIESYSENWCTTKHDSFAGAETSIIVDLKFCLYCIYTLYLDNLTASIFITLAYKVCGGYIVFIFLFICLYVCMYFCPSVS